MHLLHLSSILSCASLAFAWKTYTVPHSGGGDDTPALTAAFSADPTLACNTTILFQQGLTYNVLTPILFPELENVVVSIQGNISYATDIEKTQALVASAGYAGHWFSFSGGTNVTLEGSEDRYSGWVDSHGQQWWNVMQDLASQVNRPNGWAFQNITDGEIKYMKLLQPVAASFSTLGSKNLHVHHNAIFAISGNSAFPFNTDGFSAGGTDLLFEKNAVYNGDDCLTVGNSAINVTFRNSYCNGGHGLSIGSLGKKGAIAKVQNILIENVTVENSLYGARFKSWTGGNGSAKNVTWKDIIIKSVRFPIYITQNYWDQSLGLRPNASSVNNTLIDTFTFQNFQGTIYDLTDYHEGTCVSDPCWYDVPGATGSEVAILDLYPGTAKNILAKDINVVTLSGSHVTVMCNATEVSNDVGFICWDGVFQPTAAGEQT